MSLLYFIKDFFCSFFVYRDYLIQSVSRDLRKRYRRSVLGYFWSMLNPLLMMMILTIVFANLMRGTSKDYAVFLFCGMLPFNYFSGTAMASLHSVKGNMQIISQLPVPKYIFMLSLAFSSLFNFVVSLVPLLAVMLFLKVYPTWHILLLPIVIFPMMVFTMGFSLIFSVLNVFFDDMEHLSGVLLQGLYFLSPVLYGREILSATTSKYIILNPLFGIIETARDLVLHAKLPNPEVYFINLAYCFLWLFIGLWIFKKADNKFIYYT